MMPFFIGLLISPLMLALFLTIARPIAKWLYFNMPDSMLKRIFFIHWRN